jgi:hypothetical protein
VTPLAALTDLRVLRMAGMDWRAQGVSAAVFAEVFAAMQELDELWLAVPAGSGHLVWVREALAGASITLQRLHFSGLLDHRSTQGLATTAPVWQECKANSSAHVLVVLPARARPPALAEEGVQSMSAAYEGAGLQLLPQLKWLAACEESLRGRGPHDGAEFGLAAGSRVLHASDLVCERMPRGVVTMWDEHPRDMQHLYQLYAG